VVGMGMGGVGGWVAVLVLTGVPGCRGVRCVGVAVLRLSGPAVLWWPGGEGEGELVSWRGASSCTPLQADSFGNTQILSLAASRIDV